MVARSKTLVSLPVVFSLFLSAILPSITVFGAQNNEGGIKEKCGEAFVAAESVIASEKQVDGSSEKPCIPFSWSTNLYCFALAMKKFGYGKELSNKVNDTNVTNENGVQNLGNVSGIMPDIK